MRENEWKEWKVLSEGAVLVSCHGSAERELQAGGRRSVCLQRTRRPQSAKGIVTAEVKPYFKSTAVLRFVQGVPASFFKEGGRTTND